MSNPWDDLTPACVAEADQNEAVLLDWSRQNPELLRLAHLLVIHARTAYRDGEQVTPLLSALNEEVMQVLLAFANLAMKQVQIKLHEQSKDQ